MTSSFERVRRHMRCELRLAMGRQASTYAFRQSCSESYVQCKLLETLGFCLSWYYLSCSTVFLNSYLEPPWTASVRSCESLLSSCPAPSWTCRISTAANSFLPCIGATAASILLWVAMVINKSFINPLLRVNLQVLLNRSSLSPSVFPFH